MAKYYDFNTGKWVDDGQEQQKLTVAPPQPQPTIQVPRPEGFIGPVFNTPKQQGVPFNNFQQAVSPVPQTPVAQYIAQVPVKKTLAQKLQDLNNGPAQAPVQPEKKATLLDKIGNFAVKTGDFLNPFQAREVRTPFGPEIDKVYGGGLFTTAVDLGSRIVEDLVVGGLKSYTTLKNVNQQNKGEAQTQTKLPFNITYSKGFSGEAVTTDTFDNMYNSAVKRLDELDAKNPDRNLLNLLQAAAEEVFFPILDTIDVIGIGEVGVKGARKFVTKEAANDAYKTVGINALGDRSASGVKTATKKETEKILEDAAKGVITEEDAVKKLNAIGEAVNTLTDDTYKFGDLGKKITNWADTLTKERTVKEGLEDLRKFKPRIGLTIENVDNSLKRKLDEISDIAENSIKNEGNKGVRSKSLKAIEEDLDKVKQGEVRLRELDDGRIHIEDGRHRLEVGRRNGIAPNFVDVTSSYTGKNSAKVQELIDGVTNAGKLSDDTALGAKIAGDNVAEVAARQSIDSAEPIKTLGTKRVAVPTEKTAYGNGPVYKGTFDNQSYTTNKFLLEFDDIATGSKNVEVNNNFPIKEALERVADGQSLGTPVKIGQGTDNKIIVQFGNGTQVDSKYYNYLAKKYNDLDLKQIPNTPNGQIAVYDQGRLKGLLMPVSTGYDLKEAVDLTRKPAISQKATSKAPKIASKPSKADGLRDALSDPKQVAEAAEKAQRAISGTEPDGVRTLARRTDQAKEIKNTPAKASRYVAKKNPPLEIPNETRLGYLQRKIQDKFNRLNLIQKKVSKGLPLSDDANAYLQQEMFYGRAAERLDNFEDAIISSKNKKGDKALLERMAEDKISIDEMGEFLHAKHAPARNARVAEINPDILDGGSGLTNKEAANIIQKYKDAGKFDKMESYAKEVYEKVVKARMDILEKEHLLKPEAVKAISGTFKDGTYIPLKIEQTPEFRLRGGKGFDVRGKDVKRLKGSTKAERFNPLVQAIVDYEDAVIKAEKNKVGLTLKKLVEQNPDVVNQQGQKLWTIEAQKYAPVYNQFGELDHVQPVGFKLADNVMEVREQGKIYHITMNDQALASGMKNLGTERGIKFLHTINNYLRAVTTFYNPEFMITNFERDIQAALINVAGEKGVKQAKNVAKDVPSALRGIWRNVRGKGSVTKLKDGATDWAKEYQELKEVGGRVGWFDYNTVAEKQAKIQSRINTATGKRLIDKAARQWDGVAELVSNVNESVESGVRLSAYVNAKRAGMTKEQAASLAKNLTVNFNKKGEWGSAINSLYLFANAGIQGTTRVLQALKHKRTRRIVAGIAAFGYGLNYMNEQINPEAWEKISDFEKNTNYIFMLPDGVDAPDIDAKIGSVETVPNSNEKYIKVKLPYGYNFFKVLGDATYEMTLGEKNVGDTFKRLFFAMDESFNPLSSGSAAQLVSPTVSDPVVQMWENKNYFGGKIRPDQPAYGAEKKQSDLYFSSVRKPTKMFTDWINNISGGNEVEAGVLDFSPENVDHIIDFLGGGVSKFIANLVETGVSLGKGDLPAVENMPFARKFVGDVYDDVEKTLYYDLLKKSETRVLDKDEVEDLKRFGKQALEEGQLDEKQAKKTITEMLNNQNKIHAARIFEDLKNVEGADQRKEIFNKYIEENNLGKRIEGIQEELKDVIKNYKDKKTSSKEGERGFVGTLVAGGKGLLVDPQNVLKAMFTEEKLGEVEGNLVELQRFYGLEFTDEGGSQERKKELMEAQGLNWKDAKQYKLEHVLPVKAGGDTSDKNLKIVSTDEHNSYTPVDVAVINAVKAGLITRKEAEELMRKLKIDKSLTPQQVYDILRSKEK